MTQCLSETQEVHTTVAKVGTQEHESEKPESIDFDENLSCLPFCFRQKLQERSMHQYGRKEYLMMAKDAGFYTRYGVTSTKPNCCERKAFQTTSRSSSGRRYLHRQPTIWATMETTPPILNVGYYLHSGARGRVLVETLCATSLKVAG
jgi:hypothetical protein